MLIFSIIYSDNHLLVNFSAFSLLCQWYLPTCVVLLRSSEIRLFADC